MNFSRSLILVRDDNERIDFKVSDYVRKRGITSGMCVLRELAVNIDSVQPGDEVDENVVHAFGNLLQQSAGNGFVGWIPEMLIL